MTTISTDPVQTNIFDKIWVQNLVMSGSPAGKTSVTITLKPYDGVVTLDQPKHLTISDVFELASRDAIFAGVMQSLIIEIGRQAKLQGII